MFEESEEHFFGSGAEAFALLLSEGVPADQIAVQVCEAFYSALEDLRQSIAPELLSEEVAMQVFGLALSVGNAINAMHRTMKTPATLEDALDRIVFHQQDAKEGDDDEDE